MGAVRHTQEQRSDRPGGRRSALPPGVAGARGAFAAVRLGGGHLCLWLGVLALLVVSIGTMAHPHSANGAMAMTVDCGTEQSSVPDHRDCTGGDGKVPMNMSGTCSVVSCGSLAAVVPIVKTIQPISSVPLLPAPELEHAGVDPEPNFPPPKPAFPA